MKKLWYNIYMECIKESATVTAKVGEVEHIGKVKSEGISKGIDLEIFISVTPYSLNNKS